MHGAAVYMAEQAAGLPMPDRIIVTDMMDVAAFRGLLPLAWRSVPCLLYMHENQITYPWSDSDPDVSLHRDRHYGWINYTSLLSADAVAFNSHYHRESLLSALPTFLAAFPDYQMTSLVETIADKSKVVPLGFTFDTIVDRAQRELPTILWNHRWEYDKNPQDWYDILCRLGKGYDFNLIVCGPSYKRYPPVFDEIKERFAGQILHWGYTASRVDYLDLLAQSDIALVTSKQDFFGISVVEAIYYGATPVLPRRLAYPDYVPTDDYPELYYETTLEAVETMQRILSDRLDQQRDLSRLVRGFEWTKVIHKYDDWITNIG
jgi:glycosyltransferase involved in cell wall biosynthesis